MWRLAGLAAAAGVCAIGVPVANGQQYHLRSSLVPAPREDGQQVPLASSSSSSVPTEVDADFGRDDIPVAGEALQEYIRQQMAQWHVPGLAMAIIDGNKTWSKGFGYATLGSEHVTPSTLFYAGSMTKSFTAAAMSLLVDDEETSWRWDSPLHEMFGPQFDWALSQPWATEHITVADALSHRTGYPSHDYSGPYGNSSAAMVHNLRHLAMAKEPRVKWQYCNIMYATVGALVEHLSGSSLANFFRDRLWRPMGMFNTYLHPDEALAASGDSNTTLARAYYWDNDTAAYGEVPWKDETNSAAAGMAISSVRDWTLYVRHMIAGTGPISAAGHAALRTPHMIVERRERVFTGPVYYGFGWFGSVLQDEEVWWHSGFVNEMMSIMFIVPEREFGFVIMMNSAGIPALDAVFARTLYDYLEVEEEKRFDMEADWKNTLETHESSLHNCSARLFPDLPESSSTPMPAAIEAYAGTYHDEGYGNITVALECDDWESPADSPASPTLTGGGCRLAAARANIFGKPVTFRLEHRSGESWIGWLFDGEHATVRRPKQCYEASFTHDGAGRPQEFWLDVRMEGKGGVTAFKRVD